MLNAKSEDAETKTFIENGLLWEYSNDADKETLKTSGPLHEGIVVLVSGTGSNSRYSISLTACHFVSLVAGHSPGRRRKDQLDL